MKVLHKDGEPVSFKLGVPTQWIKSRSGACITGGHRWSFEEEQQAHG